MCRRPKRGDDEIIMRIVQKGPSQNPSAPESSGNGRDRKRSRTSWLFGSLVKMEAPKMRRTCMAILTILAAGCGSGNSSAPSGGAPTNYGASVGTAGAGGGGGSGAGGVSATTPNTLTLSPAAVDFGNVLVGSMGTSYVTVSGPGGSDPSNMPMLTTSSFFFGVGNPTLLGHVVCLHGLLHAPVRRHSYRLLDGRIWRAWGNHHSVGRGPYARRRRSGRIGRIGRNRRRIGFVADHKPDIREFQFHSRGHASRSNTDRQWSGSQFA